LGTPPGGADPSATSNWNGAKGAQTQRAAESTEGKSNPAGEEDPTGGRARQIKQTSRPLEMNNQQQQQLKQVLAKASPPKAQQPDFEIMIGASVPQRTQLQDIPPEITTLMNGYWGDQYLVVHDMMIIVDQHSRRVVAIVPNVA
jgi:hypothetical protein